MRIKPLYVIFGVLALLLAIAGIVANNLNVHDYSKRHATTTVSNQPQLLILSDHYLKDYLRYQFNITVTGYGESRQATIAAGMCQLVDRSDITKIDELASKATTMLTGSNWWQEFFATEGPKLGQFAVTPTATEASLREMLINDLLEAPGFTKTFRTLITAAAVQQQPPVPIHWSS